jgi:hypothetical protein
MHETGKRFMFFGYLGKNVTALAYLAVDRKEQGRRFA